MRRNAIAGLVLGLMLLVPSEPTMADSDSSVLWWMFDETMEIQEVNGTGSAMIWELEGRGENASGKKVNGIRIGAYRSDTRIAHLLLDDNYNYTWDLPSIDFDTMETDSWNAGPSYASLADGYEEDPTILFAIEIGNYSEQDGWIVLAISEMRSYEYLHEHGWAYSTLDEHSMLPWTGGAYTVPEPDALIMMLIGMAILALKRKWAASDSTSY